MPNQYPSRPLEERLWERVDKSAGPFGCWPWTGARFHFGHGAIKVEGRPWGAHRIAWEIDNGPVAEGQQVLHICDNPPCCNPRHLYLGTDKENSRDRSLRGGQQRGEAHPLHKLSDAMVQAARERVANGEWIKDIAPTMGVSAASLSRAVRGETWAHVPGAIKGQPRRRHRRYVKRAA